MGWPKVLLIFFSIKGSSSACLSSTLFKTILLDCILTAVISMCIFLKTYQTWWFCVVILILTMDWKKQHLGILCFITSRKIRMKLKCKKKKICAVYVVGDFMLEYAPWLGWTVEVDSDQIETLIENNQYYTKGEIANILKIPKSSVENCLHKLRYVNRFDAWVPYKFN